MKNLKFLHKKSQEFNAAVLVAIIAALIIIYMLFLPTEERKNILDKEDGTEDGGTAEEGRIVLLEESVGRLDPAKKVADKDIPNVYLFESTNSKELALINPVYVRNGVFDKKAKSVSFKLDNLENTDNVMLVFTAAKRTGVLTINLNGNAIYEYDINTLNIDPIKLNKNLLSEENTLEFSVSGVGARFWATNEYSLENIKIIGDITDKSRQESRNIFSLSDTEYQNLESAELRFIPYCGINTNVGILDISINNQNVYSSVPVCDDPVRQSIPLGILSAGTNKVIFKTSKGSYSVEQVKIKLGSKETISNVYYFEVNETTYDKISDDKRDVMLIVRFVDDDERKRAELDINGHTYGIDQYEDAYQKNIAGWIEEGNNFVKILPKTTLDVVDIKVEVEE